MKVREYHYPNREAWLADRPNFIGASEVASCIDAPNAYQSRWELWARKTGKLPAIEETESMRWGSRLERSIAYGVQVDHGGSVEWLGEDLTVYGPEDTPHHRATPDCLWHREENGERYTAVLEIKLVGEYIAEHWEAGPPPQVVAQLAWQMRCTGVHRGFVAALIGGNRLVLHEVVYDATLSAALAAAVDKMWGGIQAQIEPPAKARDVDKLPLRWQARDDSKVELDWPDAADLVAASMARASATEDYRTAQAAVMQRMGSATEATLDGRTVATWRTNTAGNRVFRLTRDAQRIVLPEKERAAS